MQFKQEQEFKWEGNTWSILYADGWVVLIKPLDCVERRLVDIQELEKEYMLRNLVPSESKLQDTNPESNLLLSDLCLYQRNIVKQRLYFVNYLINQGIPVKDEEDRIRMLAEKINLKEVPGASSVRRWATIFLESGKDPLSLVDNRSSIH